MPRLPTLVGDMPVHHKLNSLFVQHLVANLRGQWLLPQLEPPVIGFTDLDQWRNSLIDAFSDEYLAVLGDKESSALQHTLDLALFDSVKVNLLAFGVKADIQDLCVSCFCSVMAEGVVLLHIFAADQITMNLQVLFYFDRITAHPKMSSSML